MKAILHFRRYAYRYAAVVLALVAYLVYLELVTAKLEFVELQSPTGFRALVLAGRSSRVDPVTISIQRPSQRGDEIEERRDSLTVCRALYRDEGSPIVGSSDSQVSVVEFFDYRCPYCKKLVTILASLREDGRINVIYKEWPVLGKSSQLAARAALAAARQEKYLAFHTKLMASGFIPTIRYVEDLGGRLGLDQSELSDDMSSERTAAILARNAALAKELGLTGTPALVVGRTIVQGAITQRQLEELVALEKSSPPAC